MIEVQQGTPGSGKSAVAVARAIHHIRRGGVVAANFSLTDGWADSVANHHLLSKLNDDYRYKKACQYWERFYVVNSLEAIKQIDPRALVTDKYKEDGKYREGQGLLLLDECQLVFNARKWEKNFEWIEFFTQHRKLGWNIILIAHTIEMIDSQIRPLAEYESRFRNLQKVYWPLIGLPVSPIPLFVVIRRYAGLGAGATVIADRDLFPLPLWAAKLYNTAHVFCKESWGKQEQPLLCGPPPLPPFSGVGFPSVARRRLSRLDGPHWDDYLMTMPGSGFL